MRPNPTSRTGAFTLLEMSVVLVIIALVVGGVIMGQDLIRAATVHSQVQQVESFFLAANNFRLKYRYFPGDIPSEEATAIGLSARSYADGDGLIDGYYGPGVKVGYAQSGEPVFFWKDLSQSGMIDQSFTYASTSEIGNYTNSSSPALKDFFPRADSANNGFLYVWSGGPTVDWADTYHDGRSYMTISAITSTGGANSPIISNPSMTAATAFGIDVKVDDGFPQSGTIQAFYLDTGIGPNGNNGWAEPHWAAGNETDGANCHAFGICTVPYNTPTTQATARSVYNCYDNNNTAGQPQQYSIQQNSSNLNCALSFRFK